MSASPTDRIEKQVHLNARRAEAFKSNEGGWTIQMANIEEYVRRNP